MNDNKPQLSLVEGPTILDGTRDIVRGLLNLARDIRSGELDTPTTVVVIVAGSRMSGRVGEQNVEDVSLEMASFGSRCDAYSVAGVCQAGALKALTPNMDDDDD